MMACPNGWLIALSAVVIVCLIAGSQTARPADRGRVSTPAEDQTLQAVMTEVEAVLSGQERDQAGIDGRRDWVAFSDRVSRLCALIGRLPTTFENVVRHTPASAPALSRAGEAISRACVVRGETAYPLTAREQNAIAAAFEGHLNVALANLRVIREQTAAADRTPLMRILYGLSAALLITLFVILNPRIRRSPTEPAITAESRNFPATFLQ